MRLLLADDGVGRAVLRRKPVFFAWWNCAPLLYGENPSFLHGGTVPHCPTAKTRLFCMVGLGIIGSCANGAMPERDWLL